MFPLDYLIAAALIAGPPGCEPPPGSCRVYAGLVPLVEQVAVSWELLDPHESRFLFCRSEDFRSDIALLRQRYHDLHDAPSLHDCMRFPPRRAISEMLMFNRAYRDHLEKTFQIAGATPTCDYQEAIREVDRLYQVWDAIRDSRCEYYYITVRRQALKKVRDMIGENAFYNGDFPPPVPLWRFQRID